MLGAGDPLPLRPHRIIVSGTSGSGKTTVARRIAAVLGVPHHELDSLYHGPNWVPRPEFEADVRRFAAEPAWVTEWQYAPVKDLLADRADLLVWLDLPRRLVLRQVTRRTVKRRLRGEVIFNGNVEPPLWTILTDREHVIRWAWSRHAVARLDALRLHERRPELPVVRLRSRSAVRRWLAGPLPAAQRGAGDAGAGPADGGRA